VVTFAAEHKWGQYSASVASCQLSLYLCSGQNQRQALGFKGELYGATVVDATLRIYVSRWEEDKALVGVIPLFTLIILTIISGCILHHISSHYQHFQTSSSAIFSYAGLQTMQVLRPIRFLSSGKLQKVRKGFRRQPEQQATNHGNPYQ